MNWVSLVRKYLAKEVKSAARLSRSTSCLLVMKETEVLKGAGQIQRDLQLVFFTVNQIGYSLV